MNSVVLGSAVEQRMDNRRRVRRAMGPEDTTARDHRTGAHTARTRASCRADDSPDGAGRGSVVGQGGVVHRHWPAHREDEHRRDSRFSRRQPRSLAQAGRPCFFPRPPAHGAAGRLIPASPLGRPRGIRKDQDGRNRTGQRDDISEPRLHRWHLGDGLPQVVAQPHEIKARRGGVLCGRSARNSQPGRASAGSSSRAIFAQAALGTADCGGRHSCLTLRSSDTRDFGRKGKASTRGPAGAARSASVRLGVLQARPL